MKDEFAYFPLRAQKYFAYFTGVSCLLWLLFAVISFSDGTERVSSNVLLCLLNAQLTIYLVKYSKQHIIFSEEGFRVVEGQREKHRDFQWEEFMYAYDSSNRMGYRYMFLSPKELNDSEVKAIINKCSVITSKFCFDCFVVIPIAPFKSSDRTVALINRKISETNSQN